MSAMLIGFCGAGYNGMQMYVFLFPSISFSNMRHRCPSQKDVDVKTIEGTLFGALVRAGAISQDNADNPSKVSAPAPISRELNYQLLPCQSSLNRAARTDAGVHAAGNVVSIKLITTIPGVPDVVARINEELPPEIRVWEIVRPSASTTLDYLH